MQANIDIRVKAVQACKRELADAERTLKSYRRSLKDYLSVNIHTDEEWDWYTQTYDRPEEAN